MKEIASLDLRDVNLGKKRDIHDMRECPHAMDKTTNNWSMNTDNGFMKSGVIFNIPKASDTFDHQIVIKKLQMLW